MRGELSHRRESRPDSRRKAILECCGAPQLPALPSGRLNMATPTSDRSSSPRTPWKFLTAAALEIQRPESEMYRRGTSSTRPTTAASAEGGGPTPLHSEPNRPNTSGGVPMNILSMPLVTSPRNPQSFVAKNSVSVNLPARIQRQHIAVDELLVAHPASGLHFFTPSEPHLGVPTTSSVPVGMLDQCDTVTLHNPSGAPNVAPTNRSAFSSAAAKHFIRIARDDQMPSFEPLMLVTDATEGRIAPAPREDRCITMLSPDALGLQGDSSNDSPTAQRRVHFVSDKHSHKHGPVGGPGDAKKTVVRETLQSEVKPAPPVQLFKPESTRFTSGNNTRRQETPPSVSSAKDLSGSTERGSSIRGSGLDVSRRSSRVVVMEKISQLKQTLGKAVGEVANEFSFYETPHQLKALQELVDGLDCVSLAQEYPLFHPVQTEISAIIPQDSGFEEIWRDKRNNGSKKNGNTTGTWHHAVPSASQALRIPNPPLHLRPASPQRLSPLSSSESASPMHGNSNTKQAVGRDPDLEKRSYSEMSVSEGGSSASDVEGRKGGASYYADLAESRKRALAVNDVLYKGAEEIERRSTEHLRQFIPKHDQAVNDLKLLGLI